MRGRMAGMSRVDLVSLLFCVLMVLTLFDSGGAITFRSRFRLRTLFYCITFAAAVLWLLVYVLK
jgi:hypothetical protein